jgi:hypothetical protein
MGHSRPLRNDPNPVRVLYVARYAMHKLIIHLHLLFLRFEHWFDRRLGWFFTNGMKNSIGSGAGPVARPSRGSASTT